MPKKMTPAEYDAWLEQDGRGYVALEPYVNAHTSILHQCPENEDHKWSASPSNIKAGKGCKYCSGKLISFSKKHTHADYEAALIKDGRGYVALEPYDGAHKSILHECQEGHQFSVTPSSIKSRKKEIDGGCGICNGKERALTHADYEAILLKDGRGYTALEPYVNLTTKIKHQCPKAKHHQWKASPDRIKRGRGCHYCAGRKAQDYSEWLEEDGRGFVILEPYVNVSTKIKHKCPEGDDHVWSVTPNNIKKTKGKSHGCPHCAGTIPQDYKEFLEQDGRGYIALEPYKTGNTKIKHQCPVSEDHKWDAEPRGLKEGNGCPYCSGHIPQDYNEWLEQDGRGYVALEPYKNNHTKIKHQCPVSEDHKWAVIPSSIKQGVGCPHCDHTATDADVFYVWENTEDAGVYKVGITSQRCTYDRVARCATKNGMTANVIFKLATPNAREIELEALQMGDAVDYPSTIDGYTEFRRYTNKQLGDVHRMAVNFGR